MVKWFLERRGIKENEKKAKLKKAWKIKRCEENAKAKRRLKENENKNQDGWNELILQ